ncbi:MAG: ferritin-like domain-containing protein [Gammaproteobacteria bacterium]|nr:ferritin-like domain-containing protein [Gammaproteobacteria bacterium]
MADQVNDLRRSALACLLITDPLTKVEQTQQLYQRWLAGELIISEDELAVPDVAGHPDKPELVAPRDLPRRRNSIDNGVAPLIHAITHIEFNAINLAWDAVARFSGLPREFYNDWARVAFEEAEHFILLREHLLSLGYDYGDFPAHNGLWEMAKKTHHDPLIRMALVPRVLEARGLDVTPKMMNKLRHSGDLRAVDILEIILREEIGHVTIGTRWFNYLCEQRKVNPLETFKDLLDTYFAGELRGPFHTQARKQAGFTDAEMALLEGR